MRIPITQSALVVQKERAEWTVTNDWPVLTPGPTEVLIKNVVVAINSADWQTQIGSYRSATYPYVGGLEGAGVVAQVGYGVTGSLTRGDRVVYPGGLNAAHATFKQYSTVPAENVAKIPDNISIEQAATLPLALATVATALWSKHPEARSLGFPAPWEEEGLTKFVGKPAFIVGGSLSVGQYAIQIAKLQGFSPIITTSSLRHAERLKSLGATHVLDHSLPDDTILANLLELTEDHPIKYAFDAISEESTQYLAYDALAPDGSLVVTLAGTEAVLADRVERDGGSKKVAYPSANLQYAENKEVGIQLYAHLTEWLRSGVLTPNKFEVIPGGLEGISDGCERLKCGQVDGVKLVVRISNSMR